VGCPESGLRRDRSDKGGRRSGRWGTGIELGEILCLLLLLMLLLLLSKLLWGIKSKSKSMSKMGLAPLLNSMAVGGGEGCPGSLPLDGGRGFIGHVVEDHVDAGQLHEFVSQPLDEGQGQIGVTGGHGVS
jgi:hypothetical protein